MFLAIDPGRSKCGIAVLDNDKNIALRKIVMTEEIFDEIKAIVLKYGIRKVVIGNGTSSSVFCKKLLQQSWSSIDNEDMIVLVEEAYTTVEARARYWSDNPPSGWRRVLPLSWLTLPRAVDDYAAVILAERYIEKERRCLSQRRD